MKYIFVALTLAIGAAACGEEEPECKEIEEMEAAYGSPRGLLNVKAYLRFDEGKKIEIRAPVRVETHQHCMMGTTTINSYLSPGFLSIDCKAVTDPDELGEIRRATGVVAGFISPMNEDLLSEIDLQDNGRATVTCYYNVD